MYHTQHRIALNSPIYGPCILAWMPQRDLLQTFVQLAED